MKTFFQAALWTAFVFVAHVARAADLPLLVTSGSSNQILEYNPNGSFDKVFATTQVGVTTEGQNPSEIVKGPDGNIYVGYWGSGFPSGTGGIERFDAAGNLTGNTPLEHSVAGLTFAPDGTLYAAVVNASTVGQIEAVSWPTNQVAGTPSSVATVGGIGLRSIEAIPGSGGTYTIAYDTSSSTLSSIHSDGSVATTYTGLASSQQFGVDLRRTALCSYPNLMGTCTASTQTSAPRSVYLPAQQRFTGANHAASLRLRWDQQCVRGEQRPEHHCRIQPDGHVFGQLRKALGAAGSVAPRGCYS